MDGLHGLDVKKTGEYEICLDNSFSTMSGNICSSVCVCVCVCVCACVRVCVINPRRACARVTVVVLSVCLSVCLSVYPSVPALAASASVETSKQRYSWVSLRLFLD